MITVRTYGESGPPVLTLHGGPGAAGYMAPVARELGSDYHVFEPFQRRNGDVPLTVARHIEDLREVIAAHCPGERPALVGSSWGAMLALAFAAEHPAMAGPIVLIGSGTYTAESSAEFHRLLAERMPADAEARLETANSAPDPDEALARAADELTEPYSYDVVTRDLEMAWVDARGQRETNDDWKRLRDGGAYPTAFAAITSPVLILHGDTDPHPGKLIRDTLLPVLPQLEYVELERCGHYPWFERHASAEFYRVLRGWLSDHYATSSG